MDTKLTLKLDEEVIRQAKIYATSQHRSLSRIVEDYLKLLTNQAGLEKDVEEIEISSFVKSMATGVKIPSDVDHKTAYANYLIEKYR